MSPLVWDLAHIGHFEELWLIRALTSAAPTDTRYDDLYDAFGTPRVQIFTPTNGAVFEAPTNLALFAGTTAAYGVTNVEFRNNGLAIGRVAFPSASGPVSVNFTWTNAVTGTDTLVAVSYDPTGLGATSAPVVIVVKPPLD